MLSIPRSALAEARWYLGLGGATCQCPNRTLPCNAEALADRSIKQPAGFLAAAWSSGSCGIARCQPTSTSNPHPKQHKLPPVNKLPVTACATGVDAATAADLSTKQPSLEPSRPQPASLNQQQPHQQHLPSTYRRLAASRCGRSFRDVALIRTMPLPAPGPKEVLVRMRFAGINGGCETFRARGEYAFAGNRLLPDGFPLGAEGCGEVVAVGRNAATLAVGQAVAVNNVSAFSEYCIAAAAACTPVAGPPSAEAAALVLSGVTAAVALEATAKLQPGETVAVTAAAGGTGHLAVQLALAYGAKLVVAVAGGANKVAALEALDPRVRGVDRMATDFELQLAALVPSGGFDVVYEGVGGKMQQTMLRHLAPSGRLLQVGYISEYPHVDGYPQLALGQQPSMSPSLAMEAALLQQGQQQQRNEQTQVQQLLPTSDAADQADGQAQLPPNAQLFWQGLTVARDNQRVFGQVWPSDPKAVARCKRKVFQLHDKGELRVWIDQSQRFRGLESIPDAVEHMLKGGHMGKVVVQL